MCSLKRNPVISRKASVYNVSHEFLLDKTCQLCVRVIFLTNLNSERIEVPNDCVSCYKLIRAHLTRKNEESTLISDKTIISFSTLIIVRLWLFLTFADQPYIFLSFHVSQILDIVHFGGRPLGGTLVSKLDSESFTCEFESRWVPYSYGGGRQKLISYVLAVPF